MNAAATKKLEECFADLRERLEKTLREIAIENACQMEPRDILGFVAVAHGLRPYDMLSKTRGKDIVLARQIAQYLMVTQLGMSYPRTAKVTGVKHHTTVLHSVEKVRRMRAANPEFHSRMKEFEKELRA